MAQYGTRHGHAEGKVAALRASADVDLAGVLEPDPARRAALDRPGTAYHGVRWLSHPAEILDDPTIVAVASEGRNDESLEQTAELVRAGKHVWYDKPAGDDWAGWQEVVAEARTRVLQIQVGYMFRYHEGFRQIAEWARSGLLGDVFTIRAHMSTSIPLAARQVIARHPGGIFFDLAGHMLDQIVWVLGRPTEVTAFLRRDGADVPGFDDNTLGVLTYPRALGFVDIAAMEPPPMARRFEVYGSRGSAIMEPFEPAGPIRLCVTRPHDDPAARDHLVHPPRPVDRGPLLGGGRVAVDGKAVGPEAVAVPHGAVRDEPGDPALVQAEKLDVAADRLPRPDGRRHQHLLRAAQLEGHVLRGVLALGLVRRHVRAVGHEAEGDGPAHHPPPRKEGAGPVNHRLGPLLDPQRVDQGLGRDAAERLGASRRESRAPLSSDDLQARARQRHALRETGLSAGRADAGPSYRVAGRRRSAAAVSPSRCGPARSSTIISPPSARSRVTPRAARARS